YIFVGLGPRTDLVTYDKETGEVRSILPDQYKDDQGFANPTDVRGDRLFAWAGDNTKPPVTMLIYDPDPLELIDSVPVIARPLSPLHNGRYVYFRLYSTPMRYDIVTDTYRSHGLVLPESRALGFAELDESLVPEPRRSRFQGENLVGITVDHYW